MATIIVLASLGTLFVLVGTRGHHIYRSYSGNPQALIDRARGAIAHHDIGDPVATGFLDGDSQGGRFAVPTLAGDVIGHYQFDEHHHVTIDIDHKPLMVSLARITRTIDNLLQ
jgi:hypothetical protein